MTGLKTMSAIGNAQRPKLTASASRFSATGWSSIMLLAVLAACQISGGKLAAEEPAEAFVQELIAQQYFDVATAYIDRVKENPAVAAGFRSSIEFQKAQVYIAAAQTSRDQSKLDEQLKKAETSLQKFVDRGEHPRRREAQLQIASLQRVRADQFLAGDPSDQSRKDARKLYLAAGEIFQTVTDSIRETLQEVRGAKIDPSKNGDAANSREQLRAVFLQGLVSNAEVKKLAAETYSDPKSRDAKKLYQAALKQFKELSEQYSDYVPGAMARLSAGEINERIGEIETARTDFLEMIESTDADGLREAKFKAASGLLRLSKDASAGEVKLAIDTARQFISDVRGKERGSAVVNQLELDLAKSLLTQSQTQGGKRAISEGRQILTRIVKFDGPHNDSAKSLLRGLGINVDEDNALPTTADRPESTADAIVKSQQLLQAINQTESVIKTLQSDPSDEAEQQRISLGAVIVEKRATAISLLMQGLAIANRETEIQSVIDARQLLAYALSLSDRHRDAAVVGRSLAKLSPGTATGLSGGLIALGSLQNLLRDQPGNQGLIDQLAALADYLGQTWPDDPKAQSAKSVVVQLSLQNKDFEKAASLIEAMPQSGEKTSLLLLIGRMEYADAITAIRGDQTDKGKSLRRSAERHLAEGLRKIDKSAVDLAAAKAALALAKIQNTRGASTKAVATIDHPVYGPARLVNQVKPDANFLSDLYATQLRALVGTMTGPDAQSQDISQTLARAVATMEKLQQANQGESSAARLQSIYFAMANDIREEIDAATPDRKRDLTAAFHEFLKKMSASSEDPSMLQWIGQTLLSFGESAMQPGQKKASGDAAELLKTADETFDRLIAQAPSSPAVVRFQSAKTQRLRGDYKAAIDALEAILKESPSMLDAQIEAALAYEYYATAVPEKYTDKVYARALHGARPGGPTKENVIWGWGKVSLLTSKNPQFLDKFFLARYHVALCRFLQGKAADDPAITRKAITDITQIESLYPEMGGPQMRQRFDQLLRKIQTEVGLEADGLKPIGG